MSSACGCGEVVRSGDTVAVLDTKAYETGKNPLVESMSLETYAARLAFAKVLGGDGRAFAGALFGYHQQALNAGEIYAADMYVDAGFVDVDRLGDVSGAVVDTTNHAQGYNSVIMYENVRDFPGQTNPYMPETAYAE
jgi:hypothetical protein